jgi:hypothetical protein
VASAAVRIADLEVDTTASGAQSFNKTSTRFLEAKPVQCSQLKGKHNAESQTPHERYRYVRHRPMPQITAHPGRHVRMIVVAVVALAAALTGVTITAPRASADSIPCSTQYFGPPGSPYYFTYSRCVRDEQILLNDLWDHGGTGDVNQLLAVDGNYGSHTASDVTFSMPRPASQAAT